MEKGSRLGPGRLGDGTAIWARSRLGARIFKREDNWGQGRFEQMSIRQKQRN